MSDRAPKSHLTPATVFGSRVREIRELRHLTQTELARRIGIDRTTLNKIEAGVRGDVSISQLFRFAEVLGVAPIHLLTPRLEGQSMELTPLGRVVAPAEARSWIRGDLPAKGPSAIWFLSLPRDEQRDLLRRAYPHEKAQLALLLLGDAEADEATVLDALDGLTREARQLKRPTREGDSG